MTTYRSATRGVPVTHLSAVTTGTGRAYAIPPGFQRHTFNITCTGTVSAGTLVIEEAPNVSYSGTWSQIGSSIDLTALTAGKTQEVHFDGVFGALRPRLTADITGGGSVTVTSTHD